MKQNWYSSSLEKRLGEGDLESRKQSREQEDSEAGGRGSPRQIQVMEGAGAGEEQGWNSSKRAQAAIIGDISIHLHFPCF